MTNQQYITTLANRITRRRPIMFDAAGLPEAKLDALSDADEADLAALAALPADTPAGWRAKAAALAVERDLEAGWSYGEWALLQSLLKDLTTRV